MSFPSSILVTGGAGFVGSNLALYLKKKHPSVRITCMDNLHRSGSEWNIPMLREMGIDFVQGDIRYPEHFPAEASEMILECSAEPSVLAGYDGSPDYLFHTNLTGTYHCLEKAKQWKSRMIFISTSRVYPIARLESQPWIETESRFEWQDGTTPGISSRGVSETLAMDGARSLYGFTKFASEQLIEEYRAGFGLGAVVNRCSVLAGPRQMGKVDQGFVGLWVLHHLFGKPLRYIGYGGQGKQVRDVLHVFDLAELIEEQMGAFKSWDGWVGNVGGGGDGSVSLLELTRICEARLGKKTGMTSDPETRRADLRIFYADCARLFEKTQWRPRRNPEQIVIDFAQWAETEPRVRQLLR